MKINKIIFMIMIMLVSISASFGTIYKEDITNYWNFSDTTNGIKDSVGSIDWVLYGTLSATTGKLGNGINGFTSTSNLRTTGDIFEGYSKWSTGFWTKTPSTATNYKTLISTAGGFGNSIIWSPLFDGSSTNYFGIRDDNTGAQLGKTYFGTNSDNTWVYVTISFNKDIGTYICINNVCEALLVGTGYAVDTGISEYWIGTQQTFTSRVYNGVMDDWWVSLGNDFSTAELIETYNSGNGYALADFPTGLTTPPITTDIQPYYNTENISIQLNTTSNVNMSYILDNGTLTSIGNDINNTILNLNSLSQGYHTILFNSVDSNGETNTTENFTVDTIAPTEQTFAQEQSGIVTLTGTNYVQILGGSFNITNISKPMYGTVTLSMMSNDSNSIDCHVILDGVNDSTHTRSNTANIVGSMNIITPVFDVAVGTHVMSLECMKNGAGQVLIDFAKGVGHILHSNNNNMNYQYATGNMDVTSGSLFTDIAAINFTTLLEKNSSYNKHVVVEWTGEITNNYATDELTYLKIDVDDGTSISPDISAYWTLDNTLTDATGNGNTISPTTATYTASGKINGAYSFDGVSDFMDLGSPMLPSTTDFSISMWVNINSYNIMSLLSKFEPFNNMELTINTLSSGSIILIIGGAEVLRGSGITTNTFHLISVTRNSATDVYSLYIDGVLQSTGTSTNALGTSSNTKLGVSVSNNQYFDGVIDEIGVWNRVLSSNEVKGLYNNNNALEYSEFVNTTIISCIQTDRYTETNTTGSIGGSCYFDAVPETTYTITAKGTGSNMSYDLKGVVKEFNMLTNEIAQTGLSSIVFNGVNQTIKTFTVENYNELGNLFIGLSSSVKDSGGISDTKFRVYDGAGYDFTTTAIPYTFGANNKVLMFQDVVEPPVGTLSIDIISTCGSSNCEFVNGNVISYATNKLDFTVQDFLVRVFNDWNSTQILDYNILTSDGALYSTTNGNITINSEHNILDLTFNSNGYIERTKEYHTTSQDLNYTLWQSVFNITSLDLVNPFTINDFSINTTQGLFSTTTGVLTLHPNIGSYSWDFISSYFNRSSNSVNVSSTSGVYNVEPTRIELIFTRISDGERITNVNVTDTVHGLSINTGNKSTYMYFVEPGSYTVTGSKSKYQSDTNTIVKSSSPIYSNQTFVLKPIYSLNLYDEKTNQLFNISSADEILLRVICENGAITQQVITNTTPTISIDCKTEKIKFILDYTTDNYFRTLRLPNDPNDIFRVYLINLDTTTVIRTVFSLLDIVNDYNDVALSVKKNINGTTREITWDNVDATGKVIAYLINNDQYQLEVESSNLPTRSLGHYVTKEQVNDVILTLFNIGFSVTDTVNIGNMFGTIYIDTNISRLIGKYQDLTESTINATFEVRKDGKFGAIVYSDIITDSSNGEFTWDMSGYSNETFYVSMIITNKNGEVPYNKLINQNGEVPLGLLNLNIDMDWIITIFLGFVALTLTISTSSSGAFILGGIASLFITFGWFSLGWGFIAVSILISILSLLRESERR